MQRGSPAVAVAAVSDMQRARSLQLPPVSNSFHIKLVWGGAMSEPKRFKVGLHIEGEISLEELREFLAPAERIGARVTLSASPPRVAEEDRQESTGDNAYERQLKARVQNMLAAYADILGEPPAQLKGALGMWCGEFDDATLRQGMVETGSAAISGSQARYDYLHNWIKLKRIEQRRGR